MSVELEWRWADPTGQQRAVRTDELRAALAGGVIAPNTPVWRAGWTEWKPALEVPELMSSALAAANGVVPNIPPPPLFMVAVQHAVEDGHARRPPAAGGAEPPPPPPYVPAPAPSMGTTRPSQAMPTSKPPPPPPPPPKAPPSPPSTEEIDEIEEISAVLERPTEEKPASAPRVSERPPSVPRPAEKPSSVPRPAPSAEAPKAAAPSGETAKPAAVAAEAPKAAALSAASAETKAAEPSGDTKAPAPVIPRPRPSETLVGGSQPDTSGGEANTVVDITALTPEQAERLLEAKDLPKSAPKAPAPPRSSGRLDEADLKEDPPTLELKPRGMSPLGDTPKSPREPAKPLVTDSAELDAQPALPPPPPLPRSSMPPPMKPSVPPPPAVHAKSGSIPASPTAKSGSIPAIPTARSGSIPAIPTAKSGSIPALPKPSSIPPPPLRPASIPAPPHPPPPPPPGRSASAAPPPPPPPPGMKLPPMRPAADSVEEITDSSLVPAAGSPRGAGVLLPVPAPVDSSADVTAERRPVTEISSSSLVVDPSANTALPTIVIEPDPPPPPPPPPPAPPAEAVQDELVLPQSPADRALAAARDTLAFAGRVVADVRVILEKPEHKWTVAALAFGSVLFMVSVTAIVVGLSKGSTDSSKATTSASSSAAVATGAPLPSGTSTPWLPVDPSRTAPRSTAPSREACGVAGGPHVIAPKAIVLSGVEAVATQDKLALGFAVGPKDGMAVEVELPSLAVSATTRTRAKEAIRRLVPLVGADTLGAAADIEHKGGRLQGAHTIPSPSPFVIGTSDGQLAWAVHATDAPVPLWPLLSDAPVEALRGVSLGDNGYAIAFRQDGAIWLGALTAGKTPNGLLSKVASLGPTVGSPTLAVSDDTALVAWADRADATEPWGVRWLTWKPGNPPSAAQSFAIPAGGLGEQAMSPALAGASGGRFLLVWTEGPVASHQVRAMTLSSDGTALGSPLTISAEGVNAGQGQAAIAADGRGVVAFLASDGTGFEVIASPVACSAGAM